MVNYISLNKITEGDIRKLDFPKQAKEILRWMLREYGINTPVDQKELFIALDSHQNDNSIHSATPKQPISRIFQFYRKPLADAGIITRDKQTKQDERCQTPPRWAPGSSGKVMLQMGAEGRVLIPVELRSLMLVGEDGKLTARVEEGELRVTSPRVALLRLQRMIKDMDQGTGSAVDELLTERKAEMRLE